MDKLSCVATKGSFIMYNQIRKKTIIKVKKKKIK